MKIGLFGILLLLALVNLCDTVNQLLLKRFINSADADLRGIEKILKFIWRMMFVPSLWLAFACACASLFMWLFVLSKADLSFAYALDSMHYIFIALAAGLVLKEKVGKMRWAGTLLIMLGIVLVTLSGGGS